MHTTLATLNITKTGLTTAFGTTTRQPEPKEFKLRNYQLQVIEDLKALFDKGFRRPFVYAPTGAGKMVIAATLLKQAIAKGNKCLFLVHRDTLVEQMLDTLHNYGLSAGVIKAGYPANPDEPIQVAGIQTLVNRDLPKDIKLVCLDEAHTTAYYEGYNTVREAYPTAFLIGFTATPWRTKASEYMGQKFDSIVKCPGVSELIQRGYLAPPRYFGFGGLLDINQLEYNDADYNLQQVQSATLVTSYNEVVVQKWHELARDRKSVFFCASVSQSRLVVAMLHELGVAAAHIEADTPLDERKIIYKQLSNGELQCLASVGVLVEGFDVCSINCVVLARPTRSKALLFQACGRGLRIALGKQDCWMLDFGENFQRLGYLTDRQPITLAPLNKPRPTSLKECPGCHQMVSCLALLCPYCGYEFDISGGNDKGNKTDIEEFDKDFGELFPEDQKQKARWLRARIRYAYANNRPIDAVWDKFKAKFGHFQANQWHLGAIFAGDDFEANRELFLRYLFRLNPKARQDWVDFHVRMEFGERKKANDGSNQQKKNKHTRPDFATPPKKWWSLLGIEPWSSYDEARAAYRRQAMKFHPDVARNSVDIDSQACLEQMKLLNLAFEEAKEYFGV